MKGGNEGPVLVSSDGEGGREDAYDVGGVGGGREVCVAFRRVMGSTLLTIELRLRLRWEVEGEVTAMGDHTQKNAMHSTRICALVVGSRC